MAATLDVCRFNPVAGGTTDWVYNSIVQGYQAPALAGGVNGRPYKYRAESADLSQWEIGESSAYNSGTGTFPRTTVLYNSSGTGTGVGQSGAGTKINFTTVPQVAIVALKEDLISIEEANAFTATQRAMARTNISAALKGQIFGLTLSAAGGTGTFGVAAGEAADSTGVDLMVLGSAFTKTTAAWTLGTTGGSFDGTGAAPSATADSYHVHLIKRPDTGVVDILTSRSPTAPTLPGSYTLFRRIGSMKTNGSFQWIKFIQDGDLFQWDAGTLDRNAQTLPTASRDLITTSVPTGINAIALMAFEALTSTNNTAVLFTDPVITDAAASLSAFTLFVNAAAGTRTGCPVQCRTNASAQIGIRGAFADTYNLYTMGWIDTRGRFG